MEFLPLSLNGAYLIKPKIFEDERGYFFESYNKDIFLKFNIPFEFLQDNQSRSVKGVLRGLHFQNPPYAQGKLVRVINGKVLDVIVDIRKNSPTYGKWEKVELSEENKHMMWIPPGFAHGFLTLLDNTIFSYKCTQVYNKQSEGAIIWNDPEIGIDWNYENPLISEKDKMASRFCNFNSLFLD